MEVTGMTSRSMGDALREHFSEQGPTPVGRQYCAATLHSRWSAVGKSAQYAADTGRLTGLFVAASDYGYNRADNCSDPEIRCDWPTPKTPAHTIRRCLV